MQHRVGPDRIVPKIYHTEFCADVPSLVHQLGFELGAQNINCCCQVWDKLGGGAGTIILTTSYHQQSRENPLAACHVCDVARGMVASLEKENVLQECLGRGYAVLQWWNGVLVPCV